MMPTYSTFRQSTSPCPHPCIASVTNRTDVNGHRQATSAGRFRFRKDARGGGGHHDRPVRHQGSPIDCIIVLRRAHVLNIYGSETVGFSLVLLQVQELESSHRAHVLTRLLSWCSTPPACCLLRQPCVLVYLGLFLVRPALPLSRAGEQLALRDRGRHVGCRSGGVRASHGSHGFLVCTIRKCTSYKC